jgi:hypothetical protein
VYFESTRGLFGELCEGGPTVLADKILGGCALKNQRIERSISFLRHWGTPEKRVNDWVENFQQCDDNQSLMSRKINYYNSFRVKRNPMSALEGNGYAGGIHFGGKVGNRF